MNTDPQQIRAEVEGLLADLPGFDDGDAIDEVGSRLERAHQILVNALESVEKG